MKSNNILVNLLITRTRQEGAKNIILIRTYSYHGCLRDINIKSLTKLNLIRPTNLFSNA